MLQEKNLDLHDHFFYLFFDSFRTPSPNEDGHVARFDGFEHRNRLLVRQSLEGCSVH